ncbi:asparagine synthase (glutamine-hydrolyzing) [Pseudofrancisella aestuarii]|uniref:asparagine synthase (glutamine-hydrolyzing) n=1 Tax=Pseudofrancisella aestuarii TaxID=2670347 RepID=A0ABV9TB05_9GAMM|nr:asparagine synthase (glutamine-hydrolyzing) [Pseudofrancisella aestuarii]
MCGISGIINKDNLEVNFSDIKNINDLIIHRGPDSEGFFFESNFAFGHRRLAILDLSEDGHQPMHYMDRYTITYNGEVYNYLEIREQLEQVGYKFKSNTDTEVILAAYDKWGYDCVNQFNGMWSFAIYDKVKKEIFCSRDRFGVKPFYYAEVDNKFIFGSEIKQILEYLPQRYVNKNILADYLLYSLEEHTNETFFEGVFKLTQSHNLIYNLEDNNYKTFKYFDLKPSRHLVKLKESEAIEHLGNSLKNSIALRLRSDVKIGTCLSGGLDSSSIAALASKMYTDNSGSKFIAIHAKSVENKTDESGYAEKVSNYCNFDLSVIEPSLKAISNNIEEVVYTQEEPFGGPSILMQYFVMKEAKRLNCIVMLDGQGGDETLFGYESYYSFYFASLLAKLNIVRFIIDFKRLKVFKVSKRRVLKGSVAVLFRNQLSLIEKKYRSKRVLLNHTLDSKRYTDIYSFQTFENFQKREIMVRNLPHLLRYEDKNSMRHSIETRLPFVDYQVVTSAISYDDKLKFKKGFLKYLLRKVVENLLPKDIVWRQNKFGFEAPTDMWIDANIENIKAEISRSRIVKQFVKKADYSNKNILWKLYNISIWERIYNVKID